MWSSFFFILTSPSFPRIHILILFLAERRDPRKFPASTAVAVVAFPSSYLKVPITGLMHGNMEYVMVIELSGVQFGLKSYYALVRFWNRKYDFRPKLQDTKFNFHFIRSILKSQFLEKNNKVLAIGSCKFLHTMTFCLSFSWNFIDYFNRTLESDWLFCFTVPFSLAEKKMRFVNKSYHWEPIRLKR